MKNFKIVLSMALGLSFAAPQTQAGIIIGAAVGDAASGAGIGAAIGGLGTAAVVTVSSFVTGEEDLLLLFIPFFGGIGAIGGLLLDVDGAMPTDQLAQTLRAELPFIDNQEAIESLTIMTKERFKEKASAQPEAKQVLVQLSREEVTQALSSVDLTSDQFEKAAKLFE